MEKKEYTYEICPYCGGEVELDAELKVQTCSNCGKHIVTCSMCLASSDNVEGCCKSCPLEYLADKMNEEDVAVIDCQAEPSREQSLEVLIGYFAPIIKTLFARKKAYIGEKFHNTPMNYFNVIRSSEDGSSTNLYKCVFFYHKGYEITYNVETNPTTDEIVAIDLTNCDIITDGNLAMDCVNLEEEIKKSENPAFAEIRDELNTIDKLAKLKAKLDADARIMNTTNGHDAHLVELLNECWDNKPLDVRGFIMKALYLRDYEECIDKEVFTEEDWDGWESLDWNWEKYAYDYLMKVADDTDIRTILTFLREKI